MPKSSIAVTTVLETGKGRGRQGLYQEIGPDTLRNKQDYCTLRGYAYRPFHKTLDKTRPAAWSTIRAIQRCFDEGFEWVFWHDADSFIMNMDHTLESIIGAPDARDFIVSADASSGVCTGSLLVRNTPWNRAFLERAYACTDLINHQWWEQAAIIRIMEAASLEERGKHIWVAPQQLFNSYPSMVAKTPEAGKMVPGHFIVHFTGNAPQKIENGIHDHLAVTRFKLQVREQLPLALAFAGLTGEGVEVGVQAGIFSAHILANWPGRKLYSIDPWVAQMDYRDAANVSNTAHEERYGFTKERLLQFGDRSEIIRGHSVEEAQKFANNSLDFVYIDARHAYEHVLEDVQAWLPKVRLGGLLSGHDYVDRIEVNNDFGVKRAVDEVLGEDNVTSSIHDGPYVSWFYRKLHH